MYIGAVAKLTGASVKAIRHYEALGLLPVAKREGVYRVFGDTDVMRIRLIKRAQSLGFKLADLKAVQTQEDDFPHWREIASLIQHKINETEENIREQQRRKKQMKAYLAEIKQCLTDDPDCNKPLD